MSNFKIIWMSPEWNVPRSLVTWWLKRKFAVDNGRRSIRMEEQINQSFAIRMNGNLKLNSFLVPLFSHIMICIFSHLNVWLVGVVLGHLFCLVWHSGTSVTWAAVTCCLWGLATKHYNQSSNFLCPKSMLLIWYFGPPRGSFAIPIFSSQLAKTVWYWDFDFLTVTVFCWRNIFCSGPGWRIIRIMGRSALLGHVVNTSPPWREFVPEDQNFKTTKLEIIQNYNSSAYYLQIKIKNLFKKKKRRNAGKRIHFQGNTEDVKNRIRLHFPKLAYIFWNERKCWQCFYYRRCWRLLRPLMGEVEMLKKAARRRMLGRLGDMGAFKTSVHGPSKLRIVPSAKQSCACLIIESQLFPMKSGV